MATGPDGDRRADERILFVAPTRRDAEVTWELLTRARAPCYACTDLAMLAGRIPEGVGALMLTEDALADPAMRGVRVELDRQPAWSDVPVLMLARQRELSPPAAQALAALTNVTMLDRPVSMRAMVSAAQAALRARRRQYQIRDQLEQQRGAELALREADQRKDQFLATLAHELRNPLAPIRTALQVLDRLPADAPQSAELRRMMQRQVTRLVRLIDELLDLSRISTGKVVLQREPVDLRGVVETALQDCAEAIQAGGHVLVWQPPAQAVCVAGDAARLAQVVGNLVHNAAKYTPAGGRIEVALRAEAGEAVVEVADDGVGIPPDMLEAVFGMFTQVSRAVDRAQGGLGIGLSLVRSLAELHGGSVRAASVGEGGGSRFTVRLPLLTEPAAPADADEPAPRPAGRSLRVLVVDDNVDAAESLALALGADGHAVRTAHDGLAALREAADFAPDLVLCDLGMPGMDGHAVARQLRADPRHAKLVMVALTGWGSEDDRRRTRATGFDHHLVKPVEPAALARILAGV